MSYSVTKAREEKRARRHKRIRVKVSGSATRPRISIFRSNTALYIQLVDDERGTTLASSSTREVKAQGALERAEAAGKLLGERAKAAGITQAVFDRSGYVYTGRIRAAAKGARGGGLTF